MAWDTEQTRRKLLDAGARLFAAHGFAGTSMEAIGSTAQVNKERVYSYYGSKAGFFAAVLDDQLSDLLDELPIAGTGAEAVGDYAVALFDRYAARPELARLLAWESLELPEAAAAGRRAASCATQSTTLERALPGMPRTHAEHLLLSIVTLVTGWWSLARVSETVLGKTGLGEAAAAEERRAIIRADAAALASAALAPSARPSAARPSEEPAPAAPITEISTAEPPLA